jgi:alkylhydroperoxidase/carboxymuconolactone decarboxylase family protein YurZ
MKIAFMAAFVSLVFINNLKAQDMKNLDKKEQRIVTIAVNTAIGNLEQLKVELNAGLDSGLTINEIKEILIQMYAYTGFPRSLQGINTFMSVLDERKAKGISDEVGKDASSIVDTRGKYTRGKENLEKLTLRHESELTGANAFAPIIDIFLKEHLFADIFERDVLNYTERELATISALAAMKGVEPMLQSHLNMGMNVGLTENELSEVMSIIGKSTNNEQEKIGRDLLKRVVDSRNTNL